MPGCLCDEGADAVELLEPLLAVAQRAAAVRRLQVRVEDEELPAAHLQLGVHDPLGRAGVQVPAGGEGLMRVRG